MTRTRTPESQVLKQCLQLLRCRGVFAWRSSNHAVSRVDRRTGRAYRAFHGLRGVADILGVLPVTTVEAPDRDGACRERRFGVLLAVEVKSPGARLRPEQAAFLDAVRAAGGLALCVSDPKQLDEALKAEGVL